MPPRSRPCRWAGGISDAACARTAARRGKGLRPRRGRGRSGSAVKRVRGQRQQRSRRQRRPRMFSRRPAAPRAALRSRPPAVCPSTRIHLCVAPRCSNTGGCDACCRGTRRSVSDAAGRRIGRYRTASRTRGGSRREKRRSCSGVSLSGADRDAPSCRCRPRHPVAPEVAPAQRSPQRAGCRAGREDEVQHQRHVVGEFALQAARPRRPWSSTGTGGGGAILRHRDLRVARPPWRASGAIRRAAAANPPTLHGSGDGFHGGAPSFHGRSGWLRTLRPSARASGQASPLRSAASELREQACRDAPAPAAPVLPVTTAAANEVPVPRVVTAKAPADRSVVCGAVRRAPAGPGRPRVGRRSCSRLPNIASLARCRRGAPADRQRCRHCWRD